MMKLPNTPTARRLGNIITRWTYAYAGGLTSGYRYYGTCSVPGCGKEISLQKYKARQEGNMRCKLCSKLRGRILGVPVYSMRLWNAREKIVAMRHDGEFWRAYVKCAHPTCRNAVLFRHERYRNNGKPEAGLCRKHWSGLRALRPYESAYKLLLKQGEKRGLVVSLTYSQYAAFCAITECHYCGAAIQRSPHHRYRQKQINASNLDRKDPRKGYTLTNCVPCCPPCNFAKNVYFTYEEMCVVGALRRGDVRKARRLALDMDTVANARKVQAIFDRVWKDRKGRAAVWKRPPTPDEA